MHSALPKVLHPLAGRPLVAHVLDAVRALSPRAIAVVVGHGAEAVAAGAGGARPHVRRAGSAARHRRRRARRARRAAARRRHAGRPSATCPLVPADDARRARRACARAGTLGAADGARAPIPPGSGASCATPTGACARSSRSATRRRRSARSARSTPACMAAPTALLRRWVARARRRDNAQGEFYLTDIVAMAVAEGVPVGAHVARRRARRARRQRSRAARRGRAHRCSARARDALMRAGTCDRRSRAHRHARHARLRPRRAHRRRLRVRGRRDARRRRRASAPYCVLRDVHGRRGHARSRRSRISTTPTIGAQLPHRPVRAAASRRDARRRRAHRQLRRGQGEHARARRARPITSPTSATRRVGSDVNFGAGSITANYDGANKHRTVIGDDVRIGSNCVLVAPVTVGAGATIGAGSTIAQDAPAGALTVARARQVSIAGLEAAAQEDRRPKRRTDASCAASSARLGAQRRPDPDRRHSPARISRLRLDRPRRHQRRRGADARAPRVDGARRRSRRAGRRAPPRRRPPASRTRAGRRTARRRPTTRIRTCRGGEIAVVHNGIIENFEALRERLQGAGLRVRARRPTPRSSRTSCTRTGTARAAAICCAPCSWRSPNSTARMRSP